MKKPPEEIPDVCPGCNIDPDQNISTPLKFSFHELANLKALLVQSFPFQKMSQLPIEGNLRIAMAMARKSLSFASSKRFISKDVSITNPRQS